MKFLARWLTNRTTAWMVVVLVALASATAGLWVSSVEHDDDLLAFMPRDNPDVEAFNQVNELFGSLDLALVGIETDDVFTPDFLERLLVVTKELKETRGINHVLTLANVVDFTPDAEHGGVVTTPLIRHVPADEAEAQKLRAKVMAKDHLVGHLVSANGKAVLLYCFLTYGADPKTLAGNIQGVVSNAFPEREKYWGGGPFVSTYIYEASQKDIRRLTPWAVLAIVIIMTLAFRDIIGVGLVLLSTGLGILMSLGTMAFFDVRFNIVLGSMPVILFAVGSAYGIHILARYYALAQEHDLKTALSKTLTGIGPVVLAAGLTTAAGLMSFVCMDIQPLRTFGLFTSLGILATLLLSITFIPAVVCLARIKRRAKAGGFLRAASARLSVFSQTHRVAVGIGLAIVCLGSSTMVSQVRTSMDTASFFSAGSPPDKANRFMRRHFGGSQFIQVHFKGEMVEPEVLRELQLLADRISVLPNVANVLHLGDAIAQANQAFVGQRRIPETRAQVALLHSLLASDPSVEQLVTRDREQALFHIKVDSSLAEDTEELLDKVERLVDEKLVKRYQVVPGTERSEVVAERRREMAIWRIRAVSKTFDVDFDARAAGRAEEVLQGEFPSADTDEVRTRLQKLLNSDECAVDLSRRCPDRIGEMAVALVALGQQPREEEALQTVEGILADAGQESADELAFDVWMSVGMPLEDFWRESRAKEMARRLIAASGIQAPEGDQIRRYERLVAMALLEFDSPKVLMPAGAREGAKTLVARVTGLPVMHRGLSASATSNQINSLIFALVLVVLIMSVFCRSLFGGLLVASPTLLTLLVIYGGMGLIGVRLDIGTAMLASLILGAGVDYAVHLTSAWQASGKESLVVAAARSASESGPAIWTNALTVCVGFFVLTLGEAKPLKNVGGLTAAAMIVAALATFLAIPVLARKRRYRRPAEEIETEETSHTIDTVLKLSR